jgi:hypothetical protein
MEAKEPGQRSAVKAVSRRSRSREARALTAHRWSGSGFPCDHGRTSCRARATRRYAANDGARDVDFECFLGSSGTSRLRKVPPQCHPKQRANKHLRPRRPGATPSLLSCRQSQTLVGALVPAVVVSGVVDNGRKSRHGNTDANDPERTWAPAKMRSEERTNDLRRPRPAVVPSLKPTGR